MAFIALHRGVSPEKRKPVLVIAHLLDRDIPALHGVASRAVRTHLAAMDVRVAIGAVLANVCEYWLNVALRALHFFVHAAERVFRLVVIEFGDRADRTPTCRRVAVFARYVQRSVGIPLGFLLSVIRSSRRWCSTVRRDGCGGARKRQQSPERGLEQRERRVLPPRDTNTRPGRTVEIFNTLWGDCPALTTVQPYSCRTADSINHSDN